ncbi:MAG: hypothetical protein OSA98_16150 [Rubripirellula sp.]|nr:hypothetical protein [Rubripirellula sp.]
MFQNPSATETSPPGALTLRFAFAGDVSEVIQAHFERDAKQATLSRKFKLYYRLRRWIPIPLRQLLQRGRNQRIDVPRDWFLPTAFAKDFRSTALRQADAEVIHPWPDGYQMATCLTHDIETKTGLGLVDRLAALEESLGFRSSWNFVPHKYAIDQGLLADLRNRGHEICVHGYNHDGRLFESKRTFTARSVAINQAMLDFGSKGFRSPMVHRNLNWMQMLDADYDASCFDIDPFQAMPGGIGSVWPFIAGKLVEMPYTMPQDHTLLVTLAETTPRIWIEKLTFLRQLSGMALMITHPDYLDTSASLKIYQDFLIHLTEQEDCWRASPLQIVDWWRLRDAMRIDVDNQSNPIHGPGSDRARMTSFSSLLTD